MSALKRPLGIDVLKAAEDRLRLIFDRFQKVCVSFSGGKDSTVMLHLAAAEARRQGRRVGVMFIDWEAQYKLTIEHVEKCFEMYKDCIDPYWVALPMTTWSGVSVYEPEWTAWAPAKRKLWVRERPAGAISDERFFPFYRHAMMFEEFIGGFGQWYGQGDGIASTAHLVGIRAAESLNRFRTLIADKSKFEGCRWTTWLGGAAYNAYPIYDWSVDDIWTFHAKTGLAHNKIYDRMHQAGLTPSQMRICEPYGNEQRKGLWLYHALEPETWPKVAARVAGANSGALYCRERGNVLGNGSITRPNGMTWQKYADYLVESMPPRTGEHYRSKIAVYVRYCMDNYQGYELGLPEQVDGDTGGRDVASWRRVCRALLRNDYWCRSLSFSPTKTHAYARYLEISKARRKKWNMK